VTEGVAGRRLDFDAELKTVGLSNLLSGLTGGFTGSQVSIFCFECPTVYRLDVTALIRFVLRRRHATPTVTRRMRCNPNANPVGDACARDCNANYVRGIVKDARDLQSEAPVHARVFASVALLL
jgi:hypothetical protein